MRDHKNKTSLKIPIDRQNIIFILLILLKYLQYYYNFIIRFYI